MQNYEQIIINQMRIRKTHLDIPTTADDMLTAKSLKFYGDVSVIIEPCLTKLSAV